MTIITEDVLQFQFDKSVSVLKYDNTAYYRNQFQNRCYHDNKAVDIIVYNTENIWLIEIKDFRIHGRSKEQRLEDELSQKVRDTLAGLFGANYYPHSDDDEKEFFKNIKRTKNLYFVLHIEQPSKSNNKMSIYDPKDLKDKLRNTLKAIHPTILILNKNSTGSYDIPWSVQELQNDDNGAV